MKNSHFEQKLWDETIVKSISIYQKIRCTVTAMNENESGPLSKSSDTGRNTNAVTQGGIGGPLV